MPLNPPVNTPRITPYLLYENVSDAIEWLTSAFGFRERMRIPGPDGKGLWCIAGSFDLFRAQ